MRTGLDTELWIRRFHPSPAASARLVCFPHAGGSAAFYFALSAALHPQVEVLAVQYPGRQDRRAEPPAGGIGTLADALSRVLEPWWETAPAFFGHSMGAVVAYETARRLESATGTGPTALFASGRRAPSSLRDERLHLADDQELVAEVVRQGGTPRALLEDPELVDMILPSLRGDYRAVETYRHRPGALHHRFRQWALAGTFEALVEAAGTALDPRRLAALERAAGEEKRLRERHGSVR